MKMQPITGRLFHVRPTRNIVDALARNQRDVVLPPLTVPLDDEVAWDPDFRPILAGPVPVDDPPPVALPVVVPEVAVTQADQPTQPEEARVEMEVCRTVSVPASPAGNLQPGASLHDVVFFLPMRTFFEN